MKIGVKEIHLPQIQYPMMAGWKSVFYKTGTWLAVRFRHRRASVSGHCIGVEECRF